VQQTKRGLEKEDGTLKHTNDTMKSRVRPKHMGREAGGEEEHSRTCDESKKAKHVISGKSAYYYYNLCQIAILLLHRF
jgi:hypothetical protein